MVQPTANPNQTFPCNQLDFSRDHFLYIRTSLQDGDIILYTGGGDPILRVSDLNESR